MTNHEKLQQLTLWTKEILDTVEVSPEGCTDPVGKPDLHRQFVQQKGQSVYIQLPLPGYEPEEGTGKPSHGV